jgi:hypothetical protein
MLLGLMNSAPMWFCIGILPGALLLTLWVQLAKALKQSRQPDPQQAYAAQWWQYQQQQQAYYAQQQQQLAQQQMPPTQQPPSPPPSQQ